MPQYLDKQELEDAEAWREAMRVVSISRDERKKLDMAIESQTDRAKAFADKLTSLVGRNVLQRIIRFPDGFSVLISHRADEIADVQLFDARGNLVS